MLQKLKKRNEGFTIVEVLIVLAIAGLILLIVFLAVPALQRNSRNTQRKNDVQAVLGAIQEYTNNNQGQMPRTAADASSLLGNARLGFYQGGTSTATTVLTTAIALGDVNVQQSGATISNPNTSTMYVRIGAKCTGSGSTSNVTTTGATSRSVAVLYTIDTSGGTQPVCQES